MSGSYSAAPDQFLEALAEMRKIVSASRMLAADLSQMQY
jgi:hypothetical protein